jgi:hypothetical protein
MARVALFLFLLFAILFALRALRLLFAARGGPRPESGGGPAIDGEMVRDPVCGTWIDRRIALAGRRGEHWLPVCSEKCRKALESS